MTMPLPSPAQTAQQTVQPAQPGAPAAPAPPAPPPAPAGRAAPPARRLLPRLPQRLRLRTVPARIRAWTSAIVIAVLALFGVAWVAIDDAAVGLRVIGRTDGPQVVATADLYYSLSDMDTQVANILLVGEQQLGGGREAALRRYEESRAKAGETLLQAADLADDEVERRTVQELLNGLSQYERLAARAMLLSDQADHPAGSPPAEAVASYREATKLMRLGLLPKAYNLTLESGSIVRRTYEEQHAAVQGGRVAVAVVGLVTIGLLVGLQVYLARRFRRILNPALLVATLVVTVLVGLAMGLLDRAAEDMRIAREKGFNSMLALSRARAISNSLHGDQSRYLLDRQEADTYEQVYLEKSQTVLYTPAGNLTAYYRELGRVVGEYPRRTDFLGFFGTEARNAAGGQERAALAETLKRYEAFQQEDRQLRAQARAGAVQQLMSRVAQSFQAYDEALVGLKNMHQRSFEAAIADGDAALSGWNYALPGAIVAAVALIFVGVRPRLVEYR
ncbi:MAG: hypothetical protein DIU60_010775 [Actinomycetes bacterium]|jgi:hypothetical protein